jgi:hypothetical protein
VKVSTLVLSLKTSALLDAAIEDRTELSETKTRIENVDKMLNANLLTLVNHTGAANHALPEVITCCLAPPASRLVAIHPAAPVLHSVLTAIPFTLLVCDGVGAGDDQQQHGGCKQKVEGMHLSICSRTIIHERCSIHGK